jgi:hypothetical protein
MDVRRAEAATDGQYGGKSAHKRKEARIHDTFPGEDACSISVNLPAEWLMLGLFQPDLRLRP